MKLGPSTTPPPWLVELLEAHCPGRPDAVRLLHDFWRHRRAYQRKFALSLLDVARGARDHSWEVRCLAGLMLQYQLIYLPVSEVKEHAYLLWKIGLMASAGAGTVHSRILSEGYTTTDPAHFLRELRRRLTRRAELSRDLQRERPPLEAWRTFFLLVREESEIELARYLFTPEEVVRRVVSALRVSRGSPTEPQTSLVDEMAEASREGWPSFECAIADALAESRSVYWTSGDQSSRLNALVARPPGTVVAVVRPPGSRLEIEIKRAGTGRLLPLGATYERAGRSVPRSHRLDGGSMMLSLRFESTAAARYSRVFRIVWGRSAPIPTPLAVKFIDTLPVGTGEEHILDYYTRERILGDDFADMRGALKRCVEAFESESGSDLPEMDSELGLTVRFLHYTAPGQVVLAGTSRFRLNVVASYLDDSGAESYFREVGETSPGPGEARRFADSIMEQILGVYHPPRGSYPGHAAYLTAAFKERRNRARADRTFRSLMRDLGRFWGTMLGIRGQSFGESLVARNVGISVGWERGRWHVRLMFMDHDNLHIPAPDIEEFHAHWILDGTEEDWNYAVGKAVPPPQPISLVDHLKKIYRVGPDATAVGNSDLFRELAHAYKRTRRAVEKEPALREFFTDEFRKASTDWEARVHLHLEAEVSESGEQAAIPDRERPEGEFRGYEPLLRKLFSLFKP
jgi:hypothetical protein